MMKIKYFSWRSGCWLEGDVLSMEEDEILIGKEYIVVNSGSGREVIEWGDVHLRDRDALIRARREGDVRVLPRSGRR